MQEKLPITVESQNDPAAILVSSVDEAMIREYLGIEPGWDEENGSSTGGVIYRVPDHVLRIRDEEDLPLLTPEEEVALAYDMGSATTAAHLYDLYLHPRSILQEQPYIKSFLPLQVAQKYLTQREVSEYFTLQLDPVSIEKHQKFVGKDADNLNKGRPSIAVTGIALKEGAPWPEHIYEEVLHKDMQKGKEAEERFVAGNKRLVRRIVKLRYREELTLEPQDLQSVGEIGVTIAARKYDVGRRLRFSTHATPWIEHEIRGAITDLGRDIRVPRHVYEAIGRYLQIVRETMNQPRNEDEERPYLTKAEIDAIVCEKMRITPEKLEEHKNALRLAFLLSTDAHLQKSDNTDSMTTLGDLLSGHIGNPENALNRVIRDQVFKFINRMLRIPMSELNILRQHYGFTPTGKSKTFEEIGDEQGISRERIRQREEKVIQRIMRSKRRDVIIEMLMSVGGGEIDVEVPYRSPQEIEEARANVYDVLKEERKAKTASKQAQKKKETIAILCMKH